MNYDVVIAGAGVSGLTAGLILARHGRRVALVEPSNRVAPLIRGFSRDGIYFDSAFHYTGGLGDGEILDLFFRYLGIAPGIEKFPMDPEGFDVVRDPETGEEFRFPSGYDALKDALCRAFPKEARAVDGYLGAVRKACQGLPYLNLSLSFEALSEGGLTRGPSLAEMLDDLTDNPSLKRLLSLHTLLHGSEPEEVPFAIHASVAGLYYASAHGIKDGGRGLAAAFEGQLSRMGVDQFLGRSVRGLTLSSSGGLEGVELDGGERLACSQCVLTMPPRAFADMAPEGALRPAYRKRLKNLDETLSALIVYAEAGDASALQRKNLFLGPLSVSGIHDLPPPEGRTVFVSASPPARDADSSRSGWVAICPVSRDEAAVWLDRYESGPRKDYETLKNESAERLMDRIQREAPDVAGGSRVLAVASPATLCRFTGSPTGGLYGAKHSVRQINPQPITRISGVYLAGQGVAAPGILGAAISGFLACGYMLGHDHLRQEVMACQ